MAGGASRRMGADKALLEIAGRTMLEHVTAALRPVVGGLVVVGRSDAPGDLRCLPDDRPGRHGPLAGLATALAHSEGEAVVLVAVDQPLLRTETVRRLASLAQPGRAVVPLDGDARQVTCAVYPTAWAADADAELASGGSIQSLLDRLPHRTIPPEEWLAWGEDGRSWASLDSPADVEAAMRRWAWPHRRTHGVAPPPRTKPDISE